MFFVTSSLEKKFSQRFPLCSDFIKAQGLELILKDFFQFIKKEDLSPFERWWPLFLKDNQNKKWSENKHLEILSEIAQLEFFKIWAQEIDLGTNASKDLIQINSSFQYVFIDKATALTGLERGLYGIYKDPNQEVHSVQVVPLSAAAALILDTLGEDRKFTEKQLQEWMQVNFADFKFQGKISSWKMALEDLISKGILIQSIHSVYF